MISSSGGFSGDNALMAFAAMQQSRMSDDLSERMRTADVKAQLSKDISDLKAEMSSANHDTKYFRELDKHFHAVLEKYEGEPSCADALDTVKEMAYSVHKHVQDFGHVSSKPFADNTIPKYEDGNMNDMCAKMQAAIDALGSNAQLDMIGLKQLNDNMNNSSGVISGIMESRQNATASIIQNLA